MLCARLPESIGFYSQHSVTAYSRKPWQASTACSFSNTSEMQLKQILGVWVHFYVSVPAPPSSSARKGGMYCIKRMHVTCTWNIFRKYNSHFLYICVQLIVGLIVQILLLTKYPKYNLYFKSNKHGL